VLVPHAVGLVVVVAAATLAGWPWLAACAFLLVAGFLAMLPAVHSSRELHRQQAAVAGETGRPVVLGETFGAWPTGQGHGGRLLQAVLAELRADGVGLAVYAADAGVARWYRRHGGQVRDDGFPLIVTWAPPPTAPPASTAQPPFR
jgi:hypothetical protein